MLTIGSAHDSDRVGRLRRFIEAVSETSAERIARHYESGFSIGTKQTITSCDVHQSIHNLD